MAVWVGWELGRAVLVLTGVLFVGIWVQVSLMHWAGGFKHLAMWGPVVTTPCSQRRRWPAWSPGPGRSAGGSWC